MKSSANKKLLKQKVLARLREKQHEQEAAEANALARLREKQHKQEAAEALARLREKQHEQEAVDAATTLNRYMISRMHKLRWYNKDYNMSYIIQCYRYYNKSCDKIVHNNKIYMLYTRMTIKDSYNC